MTHTKAIASGKEHRKPYRKSKRHDKTCRNHGGCPWCLRNRTHAVKRQEPGECPGDAWESNAAEVAEGQ